MVKVNLAITVDSYVANWLNEQRQKRSTLVNKILQDHIRKVSSPGSKRKNVLQQRKLSFEKHWEALQMELDMLED